MNRRTELLIGSEALHQLKGKKIAVFGVGGVGSYTCEALVRAGIGKFLLVDDDVVVLSNLNRQIIALHSTLGKAKVEAMKERMLDIRPDVEVEALRLHVNRETIHEIPFDDVDYIVDAIDTITSKILLVEKAQEYRIPILSAMGAGNKLDPTRFQIADIYSTSVCPLARVMRRELKKRGIPSLKVVYSQEVPILPVYKEKSQDGGKEDSTERKKRTAPGSISFVPSVCGLIIASEVVRSIVFPEG